MQQVMEDEAGNRWLVNAAGDVIGPAPAPAPAAGRVFTLPENPKDVRAETRAEEDQRLQREAAARQAANDARSAANEERRIELAEQAEARQAAKGDGDTTGTTAKIRADAIAAYQAGEAIKKRVAEMRELYRKGPGSTKGLAGVRDWFGGPEMKAFDEAGNAVRGYVGTALGFTGGQLNSVAEAQMAVGPYLPQSADWDENALKKMDRLLDVARESQDRAIAVLGGVPDASGKITPLGNLTMADQRAPNELPNPDNNAPLKPEAPGVLKDQSEYRYGNGSPSAGQQEVAAKNRIVRDPRVKAMVDNMINSGAGIATINSALEKRGFPTINIGTVNAARKWMKDNPGKRYEFSDPTRTEDLTLMEKMSASPLGAYAAHAGNALSAGVVGAMAGPEAQGRLDAMAANNPRAALGGGVVGSIGAMMGGEAAIAAKAGQRLAGWAPRISDTAYGAVSGYNAAPEGGGVQGAITGALAGLGGGYVGQKVASGLGSGFRGVRDEAVQVMRDRGVPLTVGQAVGNSGWLGAGIKKIEDAATSLPFVGSAIDARRRAGWNAFNEAAFKEMPGHSGQTGAEGVAETIPLVNQAYSFLDNTVLPVDAPFAGTNAMVRANAPSRYAADIRDQLDQIDERVQGGALPGRDWQSAVRANRENTASLRGQPYADQAITAHGDIEANLMGLAQRQGPAGTLENLADANRLYAQQQTILKALDNGPAQQADETFSAARLDAAARQGANTYGGRAASMAGNRPFYELTTAGRSVLPSQLNDSGTWTRALVGGGGLTVAGAGGSYAGGEDNRIGGAATGAGGTALLTALGVLGGGKTSQKVMVDLLTKRPELAITFGNILRDQAVARGTGAVTGAVAVNQLAGY